MQSLSLIILQTRNFGLMNWFQFKYLSINFLKLKMGPKDKCDPFENTFEKFKPKIKEVRENIPLKAITGVL